MNNDNWEFVKNGCEPFKFVEQEPTVINDGNISKLIDFLCYYLLQDQNPRVKVAALCFASGMDVGEVFDCENTQRQIASKLNISHQQFSGTLKKVRKEFGLKVINTGKPIDCNDTYRESNRKIR